MASFIEVLAFSLIMGVSIFLSFPIVLRKRTSASWIKMLNAIAIGILVFLIADVFADVAPSLYGGGSLYGYGAVPLYAVALAVSLAVGFFMLYVFENRNRKGPTPTKTGFMISVGIGLQNLTEGLVFGAAAVSLGLFSGIALVVLIGFILQNITEGFPIAAPFMAEKDRRPWLLAGLFLVASLPTVLGGALGFFYSSTLFNIVVDGLAIGAMLYVILPMIKALFRDMDYRGQRIAYSGVFIGFLIGLLVNLI